LLNFRKDFIKTFIICIAWYNKACLESLRNNNEKSIEFLRKAIELDTHLKNDARTEEEFNNVRESKEFKELIGE